MRAVGYRNPLPITDPEALIETDLPNPTPNPRDLLVRVKAVSLNPVDVKVRAKVAPPEGEVRVLGFDAAGVIEAVGSKASLFKPGGEVYYSGSIARQGTDAEFHVVDERIVGRKPASLAFPRAAAMPLTTITAWELLFHRIGIPVGDKSAKQTLLVVNGAGACPPIDGTDDYRHGIASPSINLMAFEATHDRAFASSRASRISIAVLPMVRAQQANYRRNREKNSAPNVTPSTAEPACYELQ